jgi:hypothetical protein
MDLSAAVVTMIVEPLLKPQVIVETDAGYVLT